MPLDASSMTIAAGLVSIAAGLLISFFRWYLVSSKVRQRPEGQMPFGKRLAELTAQLTRASHEVDSLLAEVAQVARDKAEAVQNLESDLSALEGRQQEMKERIEALEQVPMLVADHFAELVGAGEKRSAKRDYLLFGGGVLITTVVAIALQLVVS